MTSRHAWGYYGEKNYRRNYRSSWNALVQNKLWRTARTILATKVIGTPILHQKWAISLNKISASLIAKKIQNTPEPSE